MRLFFAFLVTGLPVVHTFTSIPSLCFFRKDSLLVRCPARLDIRRKRLTEERQVKKKTVDYTAVQKALGTLPGEKEPEDRQLVPACKYSTTYGCDNERLVLDGQRVLYRNGKVDSTSRKWRGSTGAPAPHMYHVEEAMMKTPEDEDDEYPQMIIDDNGFPWRAEHVLGELGLERNKMGSPEHEIIEDLEDITHLPKPWEGPISPSAKKKGAFFKKLRGESSIGSELDDERWLIHYTKLVSFRARYGHADVPLVWPEDRALGRWVVAQRDLYNKYICNNYYQNEILPGGAFGRKVNTLSPWRIQMLYDVGFSFKINSRWEERYAQLSQFYIEHGHCRVPCSDNLDVSEEEFPGLYSWIISQRTAYQLWKKGVPESGMTEEKLVLLEKLELDLNPLESSWEARLNQLREFQKEHGHVRVAKSQDFELACWLIHQRKQYRLFHSDTPWESSLTTDKIDELNEIGMDWDPLEAKWQEQFDALQAFAIEHGHANVPAEHPENQSLAFWVQRQRRDYRDGVLTADHESQLRDVNFVFHIYQDGFDRGLEKLKAYKEEYGDCMVSNSCSDKELLSFAKNMRSQYRKWKNGEQSTLTDERRKQLDELGFVWAVQSTVWDEQYQKLLDFKSEFGHCNVPSNYADSSLYTFVLVQRRSYKRLQSGESKSLTPERLAKLETIGFSWNTKDARWMERYRELEDFKRRNGHCNVPGKYRENPQLGSWVRNQRVQYRYLRNGKKSTLTSARVDMLEKLDFAWSLRKK